MMPPALLARTSIRGYFSFSCAARVRTWARSAKSLTKKSAPISFAIASVFCAERPTTTTRSPCRAKVRAADAPMPSLAPVMTIVRSGIEVSFERSGGLVFGNPAPSNSNECNWEFVPPAPGAFRDSAGNHPQRLDAQRRPETQGRAGVLQLQADGQHFFGGPEQGVVAVVALDNGARDHGWCHHEVGYRSIFVKEHEYRSASRPVALTVQ